MELRTLATIYLIVQIKREEYMGARGQATDAAF
jgi:hypothetical protein